MKSHNLTIANEHFEWLKHKGHTVPRDNKGNTLSLIVGRRYIVKNGVTGETVKAYCTQNNPSSLRLID